MNSQHAKVNERVAVILLAEDSEELGDLMEQALERDGHKVVRVEDGFELGDYLSLTREKRWPVPVPDLLITDLRMPGRSGLQALHAARKAGLSFPALLVTAFPDHEVGAQAEALGAKLIPKPLDLDELRGAVRALLLNLFGPDAEGERRS